MPRIVRDDGGDGGEAAADAASAADVPGGPDAPWFERSFGENPSDDVRNVTQDATLDSTRPSSPLGQDVTLTVATGTSGARTTILKFGLRAIDPGAVVTRASLVLWQLDAQETSELRIHSLREPWTEFVATWVLQDAETPWTTQGARAPGSADEAWRVISGPMPADHALVVDVPAPVVQGWVADPTTNDGFLLELISQGPDELSFAAHEHPTVARPSLVVTYTL